MAPISPLLVSRPVRQSSSARFAISLRRRGWPRAALAWPCVGAVALGRAPDRWEAAGEKDGVVLKGADSVARFQRSTRSVLDVLEWMLLAVAHTGDHRPQRRALQARRELASQGAER